MAYEVRQIHGWVNPAYEEVRQLFETMLAADPDYSAGVCVYVEGKKVIDLVGGPQLNSDTLVPVFSSTKGGAGLCIALLVERGQLDLDAEVAHYWPEFAAGGKGRVMVRQLLSHQAGLVTVDGGFSLAELLGHDVVAARLAAQCPQWFPGATHGYHAVTIGTLADELVRRITGRTLANFYETELRAPADADFFLGLPDREVARVRPALPLPPATPEMEELLIKRTHLLGRWMLTGAALGGAHPDFPQDVCALANDPEVWRTGLPAAGGLASAAGLAAVYARCTSNAFGPRLLSPETVFAVSQLQTIGQDRVLPVETAYAVVFQKPTAALSFGSYRAFGHDGAGGALGFADPEDDLAFGYVPASMTWPGGADPRALTLAAAVRACRSK